MWAYVTLANILWRRSGVRALSMGEVILQEPVGSGTLPPTPGLYLGLWTFELPFIDSPPSLQYGA